MKLEFHRVDLRLKDPWRIARTKACTTQSVVIVKVTDSGKVVGIGEAAPVFRYRESVESVETFLKQVDPSSLSSTDIYSVSDALETLVSGNRAAKCAVNTALLDLAAQKAGQSAHEFLNLGFRDNHHVTSFSIGIDEPSVIRRKVLEAQAYPVLKIKMGGEQDAVNLRALREVAPTKPLRVDANEGWGTKDQALKKIEWLAVDGRVEFVEQPLPAATRAGDWAWLKERSPLPIFADESYQSADDISQVADCFHGVNVKLVKTGGVLGAMAALKAARAAGLKTMIGCMIETSVLISAAAHLAELCDYLDLDGNLLITNDPYVGVTADGGVLSFGQAPENVGLQVGLRRST